MRPRLRRSLAVACGAAVSAGLTTDALAAGRVVIFNMYPTPLVEPTRVFFQANAGPYLADLQWSGWASAEAVGIGRWRLDCPGGGMSCAPGDPSQDRPARYVLSDLAPCPRFGPHARSYRKGIVYIGDDGETLGRPFSSDYDFCATQPSHSAATARVTRYVRRRWHARTVRVACSTLDATTLNCIARWKRHGKRIAWEFWISGRMDGPPHLNAAASPQ